MAEVGRATIYRRFLDLHFSRPESIGTAAGATAATFPGALAIAALEVSTDTAAGGYRQDVPAVSRMGNRYLLFWRDAQDGAARVYARLFGTDLVALGDPFPLLTDGIDRWPATLAAVSNGRRACLTFLDLAATHVRAVFTDSLGVVQALEQADELPVPQFIGAPAGAVVNRGGFLTVWEEFRTGGFHIFGQRFDTVGARRGANRNLDSGPDTLLRLTPHAAGDTAGGYLVVWSEGTQLQSNIVVRAFGADDSALSAAFAITALAANESYMLPQVTYVPAADEYWVTYVRTDEPADSTALFLRRLSRSGVLVDSAQALAAGPYPWSPRMAVLADHVAIFSERFDNLGDIRAVALDLAGAITDSSTAINDLLVRERRGIAVTSGADTTCVVWQDRAGGEYDIRGRLRTRTVDASAESKLNIESPGGQQIDPVVVHRSGSGVHVFFTDQQSGGGDIGLVNVSESGTIQARAVVSDDGTLAAQYGVRAAADTLDHVFVVWTDERGDWSGPVVHVAGRLLTGGGFTGAAFPVPDDTTATTQSQPDVAMSPDGVTSVVWIDDRTPVDRAYMRRFDATGAPLGGDVGQNDGSQAQLVVDLEQDPAVSTDTVGRVWTAWTVHDVITDSFFVLAQAWNADGSRRGNTVDLSPVGGSAAPLDFHLQAQNDGTVRMVWHDRRPGQEGIWSEVYDTAGNAAGVLTLFSAPGVAARQPVIRRDLGGRWVVAWSQTNGQTEEIVWQRFDADGTPTAARERISSDSAASRRRAPEVAFSGTYLYGVWHDNDIPGQGFDVRLSSILKSPARVADDRPVLPHQVQLHQNFPNPFNPATVISYTLTVPARVDLEIFDLLGRHVHTLVVALQPPGAYRYTWTGVDDDGRPVASGLYFYRLRAGDVALTRKMILVR